jgi:recombination protein RecA
MAKSNKIKTPTVQELRKKYPVAGSASILVTDENTLWLPCRSLAINDVLGGGIPFGKIIEIFGYESTGKTLLALDFAYATQALGGMVLWADFEGAFTSHWAAENDIDVDRVELYGHNDIEGMGDWARDAALAYRSQLPNNEPILLVVDSIAAGETEGNMGADLHDAKAEMGNRAKAWDKFFRTRAIFLKNLGVTSIMINQVRGKIGAGMFESSETTPGGKATAFYASQRLGLGRSTQIKGKIVDGDFVVDKSGGYKIGQNVNIQVRKNKVAPPRDTLKTEVYFLPDIWGYVGFSRYHGLPEALLKNDVITKSGSRFYYKDKMICNGGDNFIRDLHRKDKMRKGLIKKSGINTISKTQALMESLPNQYTV